MATAQRPRPQVPIAGVPWPVYKLVALATGFVVLLGVGVVTADPAAAVLTAAGTGAVLWLALGPLRPRRYPGLPGSPRDHLQHGFHPGEASRSRRVR